MAMDDYFASLLSEKIEPSKADMNKAFRHRELRKKLEDSQILNKGADEDMYSFLTGSYVRHTAIHPFNDVDFFIVLERENFPDLSPGALLTKVENVLKDVLQKYEICKQSHSVKIEYPDGFSIDVIPAFEKSLDMFEIPEVFEDEEERWINSNPKIHQELLTQANEQFDGKLVPLIKLLKFWKNNKCNILKSFHLELLVIEIFKNIAFESFSDSIHYFLFEVQKYLQKGTIIDPANSDNYVDDYLGADSVEIINRVKDGLEICMEAAEYEDSGLDYKAKEVWNEFFGINSEGLVQYQKQNHELRIPNDIRLMKGVSLNISCLAEKKIGYNKITRFNYKGNRKLSKGIDLYFSVNRAKLSCLEPYVIKWQIVNTGREALESGGLRGDEFYTGLTRKESTQYKGSHYVNCFLLKDDLVIAQSRFNVYIK